MKCNRRDCNNQLYQKSNLCVTHEAIQRGFFCACGKPAFLFSTLECSVCYSKRIRKERGYCSKRDCWKRSVAKGLCASHYFQEHRKTPSHILCFHCVSDKKQEPKYAVKRGLCDEHYQLHKRRGLGAVGKCQHCDQPVYSGVELLCHKHYQRKRITEGLDSRTCIICSSNHVYTRNMCTDCYKLWRAEEAADDEELDARAAQYVVPESVRCNIWEMVYQAGYHGYIDYNLWSSTVYAGRPHWASQKQWGRIRKQIQRLRIPYDEEVDHDGRVYVTFTVPLIELDDYFKSNETTQVDQDDCFDEGGSE